MSTYLPTCTCFLTSIPKGEREGGQEKEYTQWDLIVFHYDILGLLINIYILYSPYSLS